MRHRFLLIPLSAVLMISACTSTPVGNMAATPLPQLTFENLARIPVNVAKMDISSQTQRGAKAYDIANDLTTPPDVALRRYLNHRFIPQGGNGSLDINLLKADILLDEVKNGNKILSYIPLANEEDYTFEVVIDLHSKYRSGQSDMSKVARFVRKVRMPLNATIAYREAKLQRTTEEIIRDIDESLITILSDDFNLISARNIPVKTIQPKTFVPEKQTKVGEFIAEQTKPNKPTSSVQPVKAEPLSN